ncbi:MAG: hypothetical protein EHM33_32450 [Chloroflexi bacterium]|nr:MAG: hypothetical protein EHM33_32450 [Chloroflexota bacterium]
MKMSALDRILILITSLLAAYQIVVGIDDLSTAPIIAYTIAFGVLLVALLLLIILGFDALESPVVVVVSTVIPLSLSLGLIWEHLVPLRTSYLLFTILGFVAVVFTRSAPMQNRVPTIVIAIVHGIAGITIFLLPILFSLLGQVRPAFSLVGVGGALIGLGGLLLSFLKTGRPIVSRKTILHVMPGLLLLMTACFVAGFKYG